MEGTITQKKVPVREIKWEGLYDKNSDKLYAPKQEIFESVSQNTGNCWMDQKKG